MVRIEGDMINQIIIIISFFVIGIAVYIGCNSFK